MSWTRWLRSTQPPVKALQPKPAAPGEKPFANEILLEVKLWGIKEGSFHVVLHPRLPDAEEHSLSIAWSSSDWHRHEPHSQSVHKRIILRCTGLKGSGGLNFLQGEEFVVSTSSQRENSKGGNDN